MDFFFLGDPELVTAFRFVGIPGRPVQKAEDALEIFRRMTESYDAAAGTVLPAAKWPEPEACKVLILTEEVADWLGELLVQWQLSDRYPLIVELPGLMGRLPGRKTLVDSIREAVGVSI